MEQNNSKFSFRALAHSKVLIIIFSLIISLILWYMATSQNQTPISRIYDNVAIEILNEDLLAERSLAIKAVSSDNTDVTLGGLYSDLRNIDSKMLVAQIDVGRVITSGEYSFVPKVSNLQDGVSVVSSGAINVVIERVVTKNVHLNVEITGTVANGRHLMRDMIEYTEEVTIRAPKSVCDTIVQANATVDVSGMQNSYFISAGITFADKTGKAVDSSLFTADSSDITVYVPIFSEKEVPIDYESNIVGNPANGYFISGISALPDKIVLYGEPSILENIESIPVSRIDIASVTQDVDMDVNVLLPDGVYLKPGQRDTVNILIRIDKMVTHTVTVSTITLLNTPFGVTVEQAIPFSMDITVRASQKVIENIKPEDIIVYVDLYNATVGTGWYNIKEIKLPEGVELISQSGDKVEFIIS
ncbi:MAG: hypothetical protein E7315_01965 [Clostridiales bacterium]|nr:hypothetical protein [Clostridiales bacterium]